MPSDIASRFDFLVSDIARVQGRLFDRLAREHLGLSRAQCRLLAVVAMSDAGMKQSVLADRLEMTPMGVGTLCARMEAGGWIRRDGKPDDRRAKVVSLLPSARATVEAAIALGDELMGEALHGLSAAERKQLVAMLKRVQANLTL